MKKIIWSELAFVRRQAMEDYILYAFGFLEHGLYEVKVRRGVCSILANPEIGAIEPILDGMRKEYRSFQIAKDTKCVYYVEDDFVVVVDWWDTRRGVSCP